MSAPTRRTALGMATAVTALAAAGRLPLLGESHAVPVGLSPVRGYLGSHSLATGPAGATAQRYDVLRWRATDTRSGDTRNERIGSLELSVGRAGSEVRVTVLQTTRYSRPRNRLEARITCNADRFLSLQSWTLDSAIEGRDDCRYGASGQRDGDLVRIEDGLSERVISVEGPLVSQWTLMLAAAAEPAIDGSVGLLEDLLLHKPGQRCAPEPSVRVRLAGQTHELRCSSCRGMGVLPVHYFVDASGFTQLVTQGALAWALAEIA